jgi:hypothetical protein
MRARATLKRRGRRGDLPLQLFRAALRPPRTHGVLRANAPIRRARSRRDPSCVGDRRAGWRSPMPWLFMAAWGQHRRRSSELKREPWLADDAKACSTCSRTRTQALTDQGWKLLVAGMSSTRRTVPRSVAKEIYAVVAAGKIVILDVSVGDESSSRRCSKQSRGVHPDPSRCGSQRRREPDPILLHVEEAHNLWWQGRVKDTWPRIAKEGAKSLIGLSICDPGGVVDPPKHLANTRETGSSRTCNNEREIKTLSGLLRLRRLRSLPLRSTR